jgi:tetratricopeptide (TPR) repeat protein
VRRLIPGSPGCLVLVTSRNELPGLLVQGAQVLTLSPFTGDDALRFLTRRLGAGRVEAEPHAAADLTRLCARLPLAMSVAAAHAAARPGFPLSALTGELRSRVLDQLDTGDEETSARTVFSWSYHYLSEPGKQLFRLLGAHPGPDTGVVAAASLAAMPAARARAALRELSRAHLAEEHQPGRFAVHDLLRAYAAELAAAVDGPASVHAAELRLLDHYLHAGHAAAALLAPSRDCGELTPPAPGVLTEPPGTIDEAIAWFTAESRPLLAACSLAAARGHATHGWQLPWVIAPYLISQGQWVEFAATQRAAVAAAERAGDLRGLGHAHHYLGYALDLGGDGQAAEPHLRQALDAFTRAGDDLGRGLVLHGLAQVLQGQGRAAEALPVAREALRLRTAHGTPAAAASSENSLGSVCVELGRYAEAIEHCEQALRLCDEAGAGGYRGEALYNLGVAHLWAGDHVAAVHCLGQAAEVFRETGEMPYLAAAFTCLARAHRAAGNPAAALRDSATVGAILDGMPAADAERVGAWITRVTGPPAALPPDPRPPAEQ